MVTEKRLFAPIILMALLALVFTGCVHQQQAVVAPRPICSDALAGSLADMTDNEIAVMLDEASADRNKECWIPLMEKLLAGQREIPHRHLVEAVKTFNKQRYADTFHRAVYRYLANLAQGKADYGPADRDLLEAYAGHTIRQATSAKDRNLRQAQLLCQRLDRDLYTKLFK